MIIRPTPATLRGAIRAANKARTRPPPRPGTSLSPIAHICNPRLVSHSPIKLVSRRAFTSSTTTAVARSKVASLLRRFVASATRALRTPLLRRSLRISSRSLFNVFSRTHTLRPDLLKGALQVFRSPSSAASPRAYASLGKPSLTFSRGILSGHGARPAFGALSHSPLRGSVGLQTARKFSSGGARVFDHLIVQAPLALRLAADQVEDKAKLARRAPAHSIHHTRPFAGPRRTGAKFSSANLPSNALKLTRARTESSVAAGSEAFEAQLSTYFHLPTLAISSDCEAQVVVTMRLIDPLFDTLGGRHPSPPTPHFVGPRLFDSSFLHDANQALEYEHRRYLRAKAILRILYASGLVDQIDLTSNPEVWTVRVKGISSAEVDELLRGGVGGAFEFASWVKVEEVGKEEWSQSDSDGGERSWVYTEGGGSESDDVSLPEETPLHTPSSGVSSESGGLISLPSSLSSSSFGAGRTRSLV